MSTGRHVLCAFFLSGLLSSCTLFSPSGEDEKKKEKNENAGAGSDAFLGPSNNELGGQNLVVTTSEELEKIDNLAEGPVFFTDPDNPDADIEEIDEAFVGARSRPRWASKLYPAIRYARKKQLPILIWFHDSLLSPESKTMAREILNKKEFLEWMQDRVIGVRVDGSAGFDESGMKTGETSSINVQALKNRYGVKASPSFVIISANGKVVSIIDASDGFFGSAHVAIKKAVASAQEQYDAYKNGLKKKGYRDWVNSRGDTTIFAKLKKYDRSKDRVYLVEYTGQQRRYNLFDFSAKDIEYLEGLSAKERKE